MTDDEDVSVGRHWHRNDEDLGEPTSNVDLFEIREQILGRESKCCELCHREVEAENWFDWLHTQIDPLDYSTDNFGVVCRECVRSREIDHVERVRELREQKRRPDFPETFWGRLDRGVYRLERWLTEQTAPLFTRRVLAVMSAAVVCLAALTVTAGVLGTLFVSPQTGGQWVGAILTGTLDILRGAMQPSRLWLLSLGVGLAYVAHTIERERSDRTVASDRWERMWLAVGVSGVVGIFAAVFVALGRAELPILIEPLAAALYLLAGATSAYAIERARKYDDSRYVWRVSRYHWTLTIRLGALLGATIILVPPATVLPVWSLVLTMSLLTLGPLVAVAYAAGRTYAADRVGKTAREALDQVWSLARKFPVNRSQTTPNPDVNTNGENQ